MNYIFRQKHSSQPPVSALLLYHHRKYTIYNLLSKCAVNKMTDKKLTKPGIAKDSLGHKRELFKFLLNNKETIERRNLAILRLARWTPIYMILTPEFHLFLSYKIPILFIHNVICILNSVIKGRELFLPYNLTLSLT